MSVETKNTSVQITAADIAEEALALTAFYRDRLLAVQSMRRTAQERADRLEAQLNEAGVKIAELSGNADEEE